MSELKDFWDSIPTSSNPELDLDGSLDSVLSHIRQRKRIARILVALTVPILALVVFISIPSRPEPQMLQCYAPLGEHRTVELSDGTVVTLNSGSTLVYPSIYNKGERRVALTGEAKFEVSKNPDQPFVVKTKDFDVRVLGTVFDVTSYNHKPGSSVVLESGSVVIVREEKESRLYPGQKAEFGGNGDLLISEVKTSEYMSWINGGFTHRQATINDIIDYIQITYDMRVECSHSAKYRNAVITCKSDTALTVEQYLDLLSELIPNMKYHISDNTITLN